MIPITGLDDLGIITKRHLERTPRPDGTRSHLERCVGFVLAADSGKELVDVVGHADHQKTFPISTLAPS